MRIKSGVILSDKLEMRVARMAAEEVWKSIGTVTDVVYGTRIDLSIDGVTVTCGMESTSIHGAGSYHYCGYAEDYRTRYFSTKRHVTDVAFELAKQLGNLTGLAVYGLAVGVDEYEVVVEKDHIHVEYNAGIGLS
jgi:hypothetical protein